jgi:glycosyltransferase involved in cell wall biosynthesis
MAAMPAGHIVICFHDCATGGSELAAVRLAEAWVRRGRRVTLLIGAPDGDLLARTDLPHVLLDPPVHRSALSRLQLGPAMAARLPALGPDLVFLPGNFHFFLGAAIRKALPRLPVVAKISNPLIGAGVPAALARPLLGWATRGIDRFVAMSAGLARDAAALLPGRPVVHGPDPMWRRGRMVQARTQGPAPLAPLRLIGLGRLEPQKDWPLAIHTAALLAQTRPISLTIHGEGRDRAALERLVAKLGLAGTVSLPGFTADIDAALAAADLLLISSRYEGGPAVAAEALLCGVPFAATPCSDLLRGLAAAGGLGTLAQGHSPAALAQAVLQQAAAPPPAAAHIAATLAPLQEEAAADAYLAQFDAATGLTG